MLITVACLFCIVALIHFRYILISPARGCGAECAAATVLPQQYVAFTFDDGPVGQATEQILDVLRAYDVPATFFLVGEHILEHPEQVHRMHAEGHVIGNHTFTHREDVQRSKGTLVSELDRTNTLVETLIGHSAVLYRPPYLLDVEPFEVLPSADSKPVWRWVTDAGYVPVGIDMDSDDWAVTTSDEALAEVRRALEEKRTMHFGFDQHVFLFHDTQATADALPDIIALVRAYGYDIVPITKVLGLSYDVVQPASSVPIGATVNRWVLSALTFVLPVLVVLMIMVTIFSVVRVVVFAAWKIVHNRRTCAASGPNSSFSGKVSVLVPAYNEAENVRSTIASVLQGTRTPDEVIVIDDGSTDRTREIAEAVAAEHPDLVRVIAKENGGKASALNRGVLAATGDVVVAIDGDTVLDPRCVEELTRPFVHERVAATAGKIIPARTHTIMEKLQHLEYAVGQNIEKYAIGQVGSVNVVPGAVGAWRRRLLLEGGGYSDDTLVEDQDLTLRMLSLNQVVVYVPTACAYTEVPINPRSFYLQRFRWVYGTFQCLWKYRRQFFCRDALRLGWIALPYGAVYNILLPVSGLLLNVGIVLAIFLGTFGGMPWFVLALVTLEVVYAYIALADEGTTTRRLLWWVLPQRLTYLFLYTLIIVAVLVKILDGSRTRWNKLARKGTADEYFKSAILILEPRAAQNMVGQ